MKIQYVGNTNQYHNNAHISDISSLALRHTKTSNNKRRPKLNNKKEGDISLSFEVATAKGKGTDEKSFVICSNNLFSLI